jgi:hypothetical protein
MRGNVFRHLPVDVGSTALEQNRQPLRFGLVVEIGDDRRGHADRTNEPTAGSIRPLVIMMPVELRLGRGNGGLEMPAKIL